MARQRIANCLADKEQGSSAHIFLGSCAPAAACRQGGVVGTRHAVRLCMSAAAAAVNLPPPVVPSPDLVTSSTGPIWRAGTNSGSVHTRCRFSSNTCRLLPPLVDCLGLLAPAINLLAWTVTVDALPGPLCSLEPAGQSGTTTAAGRLCLLSPGAAGESASLPTHTNEAILQAISSLMASDPA